MLKTNLIRNVLTMIPAFSALFVQPAVANSQPITGSQELATLNTASLQSMKESWLLVPKACKAREFNADAVSFEREAISSQVTALHQAVQGS